ncbi:sulfurtransferase TusA family protein [Leptolyngbyaceae cyanobacterium CCMR0082]|uniref:Sulfurtransferase TusA family protein n=1 Tax=Adonisia turfae CCMR0082 TaxID=2304604 RepID=A0A6M0S4L7_9CYAN|nr:sulfurtransferase TusA family protein [Adonisia turfae]MDV3350536.1 sulfurtransferase TusA family protein [Leptothoe sp. LEGE 181152]NEZ63388.1 sulfurtransferase TusA family protein [Adonisia turfae CCMR0082]
MTDVLNRPDETLDLRGTPCPLNFVRTKLKLQRMPLGELLEVWLDAGEPVEQVPDSLRSEGFLIEALEVSPEGYFALQVRRPVV